jgi:hypothetical protein
MGDGQLSCDRYVNGLKVITLAVSSHIFSLYVKSHLEEVAHDE